MKINETLLRERKATGGKVNGSHSDNPRQIHLTRQSSPSFRFNYKNLIVYFIVLVLLLISFIYVFTNYSINSIFFRYGFPSNPVWKENELLKSIELIDVKLPGPEAIAIGPNGTIFTGLSNGLIVRIDSDKHVEKIVMIGNELDERVCDNVRKGYIAEPPCGRPFGIRFKPNTNQLYVADSFYGIVKVDVDKKSKSVILNANDTRFGNKPLRSVEDIDLDGDTVYFVDSSYKHNINEAIEDIVYGFPGGRLFKYNEKTDRLDLLADGLYYPNGVQLTPSKDALLINEFSMARIIKFYLKGPNERQREVFAELPGLSDAIRLTDHNTLLVPFVGVFPGSPSLWGFLGQFSWLRSVFGYVLSPNQVMNLWPKYGLLAEYDMNGNVIRTWHDRSATKVAHVTNAILHKNKLYLGSFSTKHIAVVDY